ncbi:MAG TPA: type II toxin-antitoxin system VapC family toxin [Chloroflexota bacterium]|jgi:predicted nucleic acid-binding protein
MGPLVATRQRSTPPWPGIGMSRYLVDTTVLIDLSKRREPVRSRLRGMLDSGDELGVCAINVTEFYAGLPAEAWSTWESFFATLRYWEISRPAALDAARMRREFARRGQPLSTADTLIAAVAREWHAVILTDNTKDFPTPDVQVMPLR